MTGQIREMDGKVVVGLSGEADLDRAPEIRKLMLEAVARGKDVVVDLTRITYIDSSGIASLVEALQAAGKAGTGFSLAAVCPEAMRVFKLARLDIVFTIHPDLKTALAAKG